MDIAFKKSVKEVKKVELGDVLFGKTTGLFGVVNCLEGVYCVICLDGHGGLLGKFYSLESLNKEFEKRSSGYEVYPREEFELILNKK